MYHIGVVLQTPLNDRLTKPEWQSMNNVETGETPKLFEGVGITACVSVNHKHSQDSENCPSLNRRLIIVA